MPPVGCDGHLSSFACTIPCWRRCMLCARNGAPLLLSSAFQTSATGSPLLTAWPACPTCPNHHWLCIFFLGDVPVLRFSAHSFHHTDTDIGHTDHTCQSLATLPGSQFCDLCPLTRWPSPAPLPCLAVRAPRPCLSGILAPWPPPLLCLPPSRSLPPPTLTVARCGLSRVRPLTRWAAFPFPRS